MGRLVREAYAALDQAIAEDGEDDFMFKVCDLAATGEDIESIGRIFGIRSTVLKKWIKGSAVRVAEYKNAQECFADGLVYLGLKVVRDSTKSIEKEKDSDITEQDIALADIRSKTARVQVDSYTKMAGKLSRDDWGDKQQLEVKTIHQVDIRGLLEAREAKLLEMAVVQAAPVIVEGNSVEVVE